VLRHSSLQRTVFGNAEFASLLNRIAASGSPRVHFLTDSERLSADIARSGSEKWAHCPSRSA
jgi:hypothetical protein